MAFRMSSVQFMTNYQASLNKTYQKQAKYLEQGDGSSIHRGSDDPVAYSKLLRYKISSNENNQYQSNVKNAISWMETADGVLTHIAEITKTFKEKTIAAATDANNTADFDAIAKEMYAMIEEVYSVSRTQHGDRYIFSGQQDKTEPFVFSTDTVDRAVAKTLDTAQIAFFKGVNSEGGGRVYQFLKLEDADSGDVYYLDTENGNLYEEYLVNKGYKDFISRGLNSIDEVLESGTYEVHDAGLDDTEADGYVSNLLTGATTAAEVSDKINNFIKASHNDSDSILKMTALGDIARDANSDTRITNILNGLGVTDTAAISAFQNALEAGNCKDYPAFPTGAFFTNQGLMASGNDGTLSVSWGTDSSGNPITKTFNYLTEPQQLVTYNGDSNYISMVKLNGATDTVSDIVNTTGQDLFGSDIFDNESSGYSHASGSSMINNMLLVYNKVKAGEVEWLTSDGVTLSDAANSTVVAAQTTIGARLQLYNSVETMLENQSDNITEDITNISGTDVAKLATGLMEMTTLYNMALSLGGRVLPQSLADYL